MSSGIVFSAVVKSGPGLFYDCEELTHITNVSIAPKSSGKDADDLSALSKPFLTVLKMQYEGPVIEGELEVEAEMEAQARAEKMEGKSPGKKEAKKSKKVQQEEDDNEDEEEDEEDDDEDFNSWKVEAKEVVLGCFSQQAMHLSTNIHLFPGEQYRFLLCGSDMEVHLLGAYITPSDADLSPYGSDFDSEDSSNSEIDEFDLDQLESSSDEDASEGRIEELDDDECPAKKSVAKPAKKGDKPAAGSKKRPLEEAEGADVSMADVSMADSAAGDTDLSKLSKNQRKKLAKKLKSADGSSVPATTSNANTPQKAEPAKKSELAQKTESEKKPESVKKSESVKTVTTASGLKIVDFKVGEGAEAKPGQTVSMRYIGKLNNGKTFDSNTKGDPFRFKLGKGEVIKGWDEGIKGMKIGGERKLIVPAALAYGKRGAPPDIPPNSTLTFEVKLLSMK
ncbi:hypothetical protein CROQUDRAFT_654557 [Cronartium quercuum f. sp. fusiforme G11]|uniref:FK506-binding protein n=1 Tax=Cronartium quercuum f. sp. fusiforme G11 TaxID=708437 RepID=A0A9P6NND5_9BASI|nr:hypothetical protein CROQUDRAFT_654557 [Cronartium quercuum f. sp. fusiforme G11]